MLIRAREPWLNDTEIVAAPVAFPCFLHQPPIHSAPADRLARPAYILRCICAFLTISGTCWGEARLSGGQNGGKLFLRNAISGETAGAFCAKELIRLGGVPSTGGRSGNPVDL